MAKPPFRADFSEKRPPGGIRGRIMAYVGNTEGIRRIAQTMSRFSLTQVQLAETLGLPLDAIRVVRGATASETQARLDDMLDILDRVRPWTGDDLEALAWYRTELIPAFGYRTAERLAKDGQASTVRDYLDHLSVGGFA